MIRIDENVIDSIVKYISQGKGEFYNFIYLQWDSLTDKYKGGYSMKEIYNCVNYYAPRNDLPNDDTIKELKKKIKNLSEEKRVDIVTDVSFIYGLVLADTQKQNLMDWNIED